MKKEKSSAHRVKQLISKARSESPLENKQRNYRHERSAPIPKGIDGISFSKSSENKRKIAGAKVILQKSSKKTLEQLHCTHNQNYPLFFIEKAEALQMKHIENLRVKERIIAARSIKILSMEIQKWIYAHVHQKVKIIDDDALEFCNLLEKREERHFRIDRIIKYLSEP